jgi:hypothetical protein
VALELRPEQHVTGLVAVISKDRARPVPDSEIAGLADAYELLHECGERHAAAAGDYARVVKFDRATADRPGIERSGASWAAMAGVVHAGGSLVNAPLQSLDGQFGLISHETERDEVVVATDPFAHSTRSSSPSGTMPRTSRRRRWRSRGTCAQPRPS